MNAKDFIDAYNSGRTLVNDELNADIRRTDDHIHQMHINAELIVFFKEIKETHAADVVSLVCDDYSCPMATYRWRVKE